MKDSRDAYEAIISEINSAASYLEAEVDVDERDFLKAYLNSLLSVKHMMNIIYGEDVKV